VQRPGVPGADEAELAAPRVEYAVGQGEVLLGLLVVGEQGVQVGGQGGRAPAPARLPSRASG
jgi:hypothetical protein